MSRVARTEGEQLDNAAYDMRIHRQLEGLAPSRHVQVWPMANSPYAKENLSNLIAAKSLTSPPTRLVA
jgi:hypothetical protein